METKIRVNITFNVYDQLKGKDEFLATLNQEGIVVQERKIWHPAACTGQEIDAILVLINNPIMQFLAKVAMEGMAFELMKHYVPKFFEALGRLQDQNEEFSVGCLQFEFDDITIKIRDLRDVDYAYLQDTFFNMGAHIEYLNQQEIRDIREISLPYVKKNGDFEENRDEYEKSMDSSKEKEFYWKIEYANGCMKCYYNPKDRAIVEA